MFQNNELPLMFLIELRWLWNSFYFNNYLTLKPNILFFKCFSVVYQRFKLHIF